jgi:hypothetical protein
VEVILIIVIIICITQRALFMREAKESSKHLQMITKKYNIKRKDVVLLEGRLKTQVETANALIDENHKLRKEIKELEDHQCQLEEGYLVLSARYEDYIQMVESDYDDD